jgi:hypothetical protein
MVAGRRGWFAALLAAVGLLATAGCRESRASAGRGVVDSVVPRDVALTRFRAGLVEPESLVGGVGSRDSLLAGYLGALAQRDTATLIRLAMTKAEFAWLYYPTNPRSLPPYDLDPDLMWFLQVGNSDNGLREALNVYGGRRLRYLGARCDADSSVQAANVLWGPCWIRFVRSPADTIEDRLVSMVIRRDGRFKIVSYANKID